MRKWGVLKTDRFHTILISIVFAATALPLLEVPFAHAQTNVNNRYVRLGTSAPSSVTTYQAGFDFTNTAVPVGSVSIEFCSNDPLPNTPCTAPAGFDASGRTLDAQTGEIGFSIDAGSTSNKIILTRPAAAPAAGASRYDFGNIINPNYIGTFYVRLQTFTSTDGTGADIENGGVALSTSEALNVQSEVPPYLKFCAAVTIVTYDCSSATSYLIDMGELLTTQTSRASTEFVVATNADSGYSVTVNGSTLVSGNNIIPGLVPGGASVVGTSQFGINLRSNTAPGIGAEPAGPGTGVINGPYALPNIFRYQNGDVVASAPGPSDDQKYTVSYITNIDAAQQPGYYATTFTYICLANF